MRELNQDGAFRILCGFREQSISKRFLMPDEVLVLLSEVHKDRDRAMLRLILEHGLSLTEVIEVRRDHYDEARGILVVDKRDVALSPPLRAFLKVCDGEIFAVGERSAQKILTRACKAAGIPEATSKDLRRTFAVYFLAAGGGIDVLSSVMGMTVEGTVRMLGISSNGIDDVPAHRAFTIIFGDGTSEYDEGRS